MCGTLRCEARGVFLLIIALFQVDRNYTELLGKASKSSCVLASRVEAETDEELEELFSLWKMTKSDENYNRILRKYEIIDSGSLEGALNYYEGFGYMPYEGSTKSEYAIVTYYYFFSSKGKLIFKLTDWGTAEKISVDLGDDVSTYVYIP